MKANVATITGSVNYGAPNITPTDRFIVLSATQMGNIVYNLNTTEPCTII